MMNEKKEALCREILELIQSELSDLLPHLDGAFAALRWEASAERGLRTDGDHLFFCPEDLLRQFGTDPGALKRGYLHILLHCLYLHPFFAEHSNKPLWDLACDLAVEQIIEGLRLPRLGVSAEHKQAVFQSLKEDCLTAEQIYGYLTDHDLHINPEDFYIDDHSLWHQIQDGPGKAKWERLLLSASGKKTGRGKRGASPGSGQEAVSLGISSEFDYRRYLARFTFPREELQLDMESFDYAYYQLGMERYNGMPLIEPLEYQEVRRLEELVIAIDTSGSCSAETVGRFLAETYQILAAQENFFQKMKVYFIQCDCVIEDVTCIRSRKDWMDYSQKVVIQGRGGTDFTPVFHYVAKLREEKELRDLKALLYFTDGDGVYPSSPPDYETAFVLLEESSHPELVPKWGRLLLI